MKTIVVPVDLSPVAAPVCQAACALARQIRARLLLIHIVELPVMMNDPVAPDGIYIQDAIDAAISAGHRRLAVLQRACAKRGVTARTFQTVGSPVADIMARAKKAAFIVIGSHGHGAMYDLVVGSTTVGVLKRAQCPVIVIPDRTRRSK